MSKEPISNAEELTSQMRQEVSKGSGIDEKYKDWFLEYASYVILDRAVPYIDDGLKPVQRRILHSLNELEDGRYNKAANVIGHTMRYHPHGDMAIGDALVKIAQKDLLIDTQGNWGNPITGDRAAAPRYIEARLSDLAKEILFNDKTTKWQMSYDGRNKEPVKLPVKFPLLLALGVEGIAVGLATKILPHNFVELIRESIAILRGYEPKLLPDFPSGGVADFGAYNDGKKGGKIRVRAVINVESSKLLKIVELPFGVTTSGMIDSILSANDKGQLKIKKIEDNTAQNVEILVHLPPSASPEKMIQALYAFTDCEVSISPNCCVIADNKPQFCGVSDVLKHSVNETKRLLTLELELEQARLKQRLHFSLLEKIFIEHKIYRKIEKAETWDDVLLVIRKSLKAHKDDLLLELSEDDIVKLTEIKIKRISKFDSNRAEEVLSNLRSELAEVEKNLGQITKYSIQYFNNLQKKFAKGRERKTRMETFSKVKVTALAVSDQKLYVNRKDGFIGTGLKKEEFLFECSKMDEIIAVCQDGTFMVSKVSNKMFVGKDIIHVAIFKRGDERKIYHLVYRDGKAGAAMVKRFNITSITRDKQYHLTKGSDHSKVLYFSVNANGESEKIKAVFKPSAKLRKKDQVFDFASMPVKSRSGNGIILTKNPVSKVLQILKGASTLAAQRLWFDKEQMRLNSEGQGQYLGKFEGEEQLIAVYSSGNYEIVTCDLEQSFADGLIELQKWVPNETVLSVIYYDGQREDVYVKRALIEESLTGSREYIPKTKGSKVLLATLKVNPVVRAEFLQSRKTSAQTIKLQDFIDIKSLKSVGNKLSKYQLKGVKIIPNIEV